MDKVGRYEFMAEPFHCDFSGHLFMGHMGNHMLNAADFHSSARGFGMKYLMSIHRSWVLSRLAIEMTEMPEQYVKFNVETWVESAMRYFTSRNFSVIGNDGHIYGYGRSIWAMIDTETRQPTDIFSIDNGAINNWIVKDKECPIDKGGRVKMSDDAQLVRTIDTHYNDVDINGHINSVKYIEHVLDHSNGTATTTSADSRLLTLPRRMPATSSRSIWNRKPLSKAKPRTTSASSVPTAPSAAAAKLHSEVLLPMLALAPQFAVQVGALVITGSKPSVILCLFAYEFPVWMLILPSVFRLSSYIPRDCAKGLLSFSYLVCYFNYLTTKGNIHGILLCSFIQQITY